MNQFCPVTMIANTTPGTHNPRISAKTVTKRLREISERPPYTMYVSYAAFLFWPSICLSPVSSIFCTHKQIKLRSVTNFLIFLPIFVHR